MDISDDIGKPWHWLEAKLLGFLTPEERAERIRLLRLRAKGTITEVQEERLVELAASVWPRLLEAREHDRLNPPTPENDLTLYAKEVGDRMRARLPGVSADS